MKAAIDAHLGIIKEIRPDLLRVSIQQTSACSGCAAKSNCGMSESKEILIDVPINGGQYKVGQLITLHTKSRNGSIALFIGYLLPFLLLMGTLLFTYGLTGDEKLSGLFALLILVPYYAVVFLQKNKLSETFRFTLDNG